MASLLEDIGQYIINAGLASNIGQDIWLDYDPDEPANVIILNESDSKSSPIEGQTGVRYVQIITRNLQPTPAKTLACRLHKLFLLPDDNISNLPNDRWCIFNIKNGPLKIKVDAKQRTLYGFNVAITTNFD